MPKWALILFTVLTIVFLMFIFLALYKMVILLIVAGCAGGALFITFKIVYPIITWAQKGVK
jgi:hypothetical protein